MYDNRTCRRCLSPTTTTWVEAFPADRADQPLRIAILPWRPRRDGLITDAQRSHATDEHLAVAGIPITDQMVRCWLPATGFRELIGKPLCSRMRGHADMDQLSSPVMQDNEAKQHP